MSKHKKLVMCVASWKSELEGRFFIALCVTTPFIPCNNLHRVDFWGVIILLRCNSYIIIFIWVCSLMFFSIFTELCKHHHNFKTFLSPSKEAQYPLALIPTFPNPPSPKKPLVFLMCDLSLLDISCKWSHRICNLL